MLTITRRVIFKIRNSHGRTPDVTHDKKPEIETVLFSKGSTTSS